MKRTHVARVVLVVASGLACLAFGAEPVVDGPGWTGLTNPEDVISARQALMVQIEHVMRPIESFAGGDSGSPAELRAIAGTMAPMLLAAPHLFPPTTNLYDAAAETPTTLALPAIWQDFPTFYTLASASAAAAASMASVTAIEPLRAAGRNLRATCDACHARYVRPYVPATVNSDDLEFDFDSVLPKD
jgi:cytochrome c556